MNYEPILTAMFDIPYNKLFLTGNEEKYLQQALQNGKIGAGGSFTNHCVNFLEEKYQFKKCFLTTSCTAALEMSALLIGIKTGDEVILPSYTFVSTANAFLIRGAKLIFVDSESEHPNMDISKIEALITPKTKAIVAMHYAGMACDIQRIKTICDKYQLFLIEDAAQCIDSYYKHEDGSLQALGTFGHFAAFSFHESKNITSGEGGMLVVNDENFIEKTEICYEKGTNRAQFLRGEVKQYEWQSLGSSFAMSELTASFLWAQLERLDEIQQNRLAIWQRYDELINITSLVGFKIGRNSDYSIGNAHIFYLICTSIEQRNQFLQKLAEAKIQATFHFLPLHDSPYFKTVSSNKNESIFTNSLNFSDTLIRLPLFNSLTKEEQLKVIESIHL